jgi:hypothetical protein
MDLLNNWDATTADEASQVKSVIRQALLRSGFKVLADYGVDEIRMSYNPRYHLIQIMGQKPGLVFVYKISTDGTVSVFDFDGGNHVTEMMRAAAGQ